MLTVHQLSKSFNLQPLFENVTFSVNRGDRVGLIGPNGCGKTTLLRLIAGRERSDAGHIARNPGTLRVGYLAQGLELDPDRPVGDLISAAGGDSDYLERELARLGEALAAAPTRRGLAAAYDDILQRLTRHDETTAVQLRRLLGLQDVPAGQPAGQLSGGQKTRLALLLLLLDQPDLLLLDEPTNHLDVDMLEWLEQWLADFPGGALIVSHDRTFLDRTVNRIVALDPETHQAREYPGNYTSYLEQVRFEREKEGAMYRDQENEIRRMKRDIERTREQARGVERSTTPREPGVRAIAKKVARKARAREKKLDRYLEADDRLEKPRAGWQMKLSFDQDLHVGRDVLMLNNLAIGYPPAPPLLEGITQNIRAGERVALLGPNGCGKTTLLRTLTGEQRPLRGTFRLGASVRLGYLSQEQEQLDAFTNAVEAIRHSAAAPLTETEIRSFLHYFLFAGDDALRNIGELSYGERTRLMLARLVAGGCTLLLLDEPINHLDIPSRTRFEQALQRYEGTVLMVVHDRYFVDQVATTEWRIAGRSIEKRWLTVLK